MSLQWARANLNGPLHAWDAEQPTDTVWVSLCRWYAQCDDLVEDEAEQCGSCAMLAHGLDLADRQGDSAWR
jgi:hypothetical protein